MLNPEKYILLKKSAALHTIAFVIDQQYEVVEWRCKVWADQQNGGYCAPITQL